MNNNYVIRDDGIAHFISNSEELDELDTMDVLKQQYPYILDSMNEEDFKLEYPHCQLFKEILHNNMVIGFATYNLDTGVDEFCMNAIYVLPKFRGNKSFYNEILYILNMDNSFSICEPTQLLIKLLIKYDFARKLNNYLVATAFNLYVPSENYICNQENTTLDDEFFYASTLYDLNISASILLDDITSPNTNIIYYSRLLDEDIKHFNAFEKRQKLNSKYFDKIKKHMTSNVLEWSLIMDHLKNNLPKPEFDIYELVGKPPEISDTLELIIEDGILTPDQAVKLQKQIIDEYENGEVLPESLRLRLAYLTMEYESGEEESIEDVLEKIKGKLHICPYCHEEISPIEESCKICGFNLNYVPEGAKNHDFNIEDIDFEDFGEIEETPNYLTPENSKDLYDKLEGILEQNMDEDDYFIPYLANTVLLQMNKGYDFEKSCKMVCAETQLRRELKQYMIDKDYVANNLTKENWQSVGQKLTVPNLKEILKEHNQKISGNKQELIDRIAENITLKDITNYKVYTITKKGYEILNS